MYVCLCKGVTDARVREAVQQGAHSMAALRAELGVCTECKKCAVSINGVLRDTLMAAPVVAAPLCLPECHTSV
jgi:bacterioferritin-associated ferredoxin